MYMRHRNKIKNIIRMLIGSRFYFDLSLRERLDFIKDILQRFPASIGKPMSFPVKDLFFQRER